MPRILCRETTRHTTTALARLGQRVSRLPSWIVFTLIIFGPLTTGARIQRERQLERIRRQEVQLLHVRYQLADLGARRQRCPLETLEHDDGLLMYYQRLEYAYQAVLNAADTPSRPALLVEAERVSAELLDDLKNQQPNDGPCRLGDIQDVLLHAANVIVVERTCSASKTPSLSIAP